MHEAAERDRLAATLDPRGVTTGYHDAFGNWRLVPHQTLSALEPRFPADGLVPAPIVVEPGAPHPQLHGQLTVTAAAGTAAQATVVTGTLPDDIPVGYHTLHTADGTRHLVIVAPPALPQPTGRVGVAVQLYAARTAHSWGIGDFRDLRRIGTRAAAHGVDFLLLSPVHANGPGRQEPSPYSPASRTWLNLLHIAVDEAPDADRVDLSDLTGPALACNNDRMIDRERVWQLKRTGLERIYAAQTEPARQQFEQWAVERGAALQRFATWCALAEVHGPSWRTWPSELHAVAGAAVQQFAAEHNGQVRFWAWCQWVADLQLAAACSGPVEIVADLAVGFDANGADAWLLADYLAFDFEVGCPPDMCNPDGQRWGLPPLDPQQLLAGDLQPFIDMIASALRHAHALRIDHVMQLWRLFWIPLDGTGADGAYVRYPTEALRAVLRVEAARRGAWLIGEDLGTVPVETADQMSADGMLSYRLALLSDPAGNIERSVAAYTTHDLPTVAGTLTGLDVQAQAQIGKAYDAETEQRARLMLAELAGLDLHGELGPAQIVAATVAAYTTIARCPSQLVLATLDDLAGVWERPNMPGTVDEWPNWRIALPRPADALFDEPLGAAVLAALRAGC